MSYNKRYRSSRSTGPHFNPIAESEGYIEALGKTLNVESINAPAYEAMEIADDITEIVELVKAAKKRDRSLDTSMNTKRTLVFNQASLISAADKKRTRDASLTQQEVDALIQSARHKKAAITERNVKFKEAARSIAEQAQLSSTALGFQGPALIAGVPQKEFTRREKGGLEAYLHKYYPVVFAAPAKQYDTEATKMNAYMNPFASSEGAFASIIYKKPRTITPVAPPSPTLIPAKTASTVTTKTVSTIPPKTTATTTTKPAPTISSTIVPKPTPTITPTTTVSTIVPKSSSPTGMTMTKISPQPILSASPPPTTTPMPQPVVTSFMSPLASYVKSVITTFTPSPPTTAAPVSTIIKANNQGLEISTTTVPQSPKPSIDLQSNVTNITLNHPDLITPTKLTSSINPFAQASIVNMKSTEMPVTLPATSIIKPISSQPIISSLAPTADTLSVPVTTSMVTATSTSNPSQPGNIAISSGFTDDALKKPPGPPELRAAERLEATKPTSMAPSLSQGLLQKQREEKKKTILDSVRNTSPVQDKIVSITGPTITTTQIRNDSLFEAPPSIPLMVQDIPPKLLQEFYTAYNIPREKITATQINWSKPDKGGPFFPGNPSTWGIFTDLLNIRDKFGVKPANALASMYFQSSNTLDAFMATVPLRDWTIARQSLAKALGITLK